MNRDYGFYFEEAGRSRPQGAISSDEEHFEGSSAEQSVARELGQNSLDAIDPDGAGVVRMVFELREMSTERIPDISNLRRHLDAVVRATGGSKGHERMVRAAEAAHEESIWVLRVGDYGTTGLTGSESRQDPTSPLVALTRGAGISANNDGRGGSFGIGSAVGSMSSDLCTVLWTSMPKGATDVVFAGYSRLATHEDENGDLRQADGFFTRLVDKGDFVYLRNPSAIGPFAQRTENGTDVYVLGYRKAAEDPMLEHIRDAFAANFFYAIHTGSLVVEGRTAHGNWVLDSDSLSGVVQALDEVAPFYRALHDPEPYVREVPDLGELKLFVELDDTLQKKLHTVSVRSPLMRIAEYKNNTVTAKYAAVLDCSNPTANAKLRRLEPPLHDRWDPARDVDGARLNKAIRRFVLEGLRSKVGAQIGEEVRIDGLQRLLPANLGPLEQSGEARRGDPTLGPGCAEESSTVQGRPSDELAVTNPKRRSVTVQVQKPATNDGGSPVRRGRDADGTSTRGSKGGNLDGGGAEGDGSARIPAGSVVMRSWTDSETGDLIVIVKASSPMTGNLRLAPVVAGGDPDSSYALPIKSVVQESHSGSRPILHAGNTLQDVELGASDSGTRFRIALTEPHRYRMAVI